MHIHEEAVERALTPEQCLILIAAKTTGRLVYGDGGPRVLPVNFALRAGVIVVRTSDPVPNQGLLTFEIDEIDEVQQQAWSVIVSGPARTLPLTEVNPELVADLEPWAPGERRWVTLIDVERVTGRWVRAARDVFDGGGRGYL